MYPDTDGQQTLRPLTSFQVDILSFVNEVGWCSVHRFLLSRWKVSSSSDCSNHYFSLLVGNSKEEQNESMITCSSGFVMSMHGKEAECNRVMFYNVQSTSYNFFAFCFK